MERIGIFGGTFNPIHNGHVKLAQGFLTSLKLDRVLLIPVWSPPHKSAKRLLPAQERLAMCRLACADDRRLETCGIEVERGGMSYTVDTLRELARRMQNAQFFLITGADMFLTLEKWKSFDEIIKYASLCACSRKEGELMALRDYARRLETVYGARCCVEDFPVTEVSSTQVRAMLEAGGDVSNLIPRPVLDYIESRGLYGTKKGSEFLMQETHNEILERFRGILKERLTEKRFFHSCMVSLEAAKLAKQYGGDVEKAELAGLVHDIEKDTPTPLQLQTIEKYSIILDDVEKATPKLLHAIAGAAVLQYEHNVSDSDILNAVRYHTTARAGMSLLEKILYLADYISADRDYEGVEELRKTVYASLDEGMETALRFSITELSQKNAPIHLNTVSAWNVQILAKNS